MAVGAGAALLRSAATKMARAPPCLPSALERHGRFSTSSGSTPTREPQTDIKRVRSGSGWERYDFFSGSGWERAKTAFIETATLCAFLTVPAVAVLYFWVNPALDRINADFEAEIIDEIKRGHQRIHDRIDSMKKLD